MDAYNSETHDNTQSRPGYICNIMFSESRKVKSKTSMLRGLQCRCLFTVVLSTAVNRKARGITLYGSKTIARNPSNTGNRKPVVDSLSVSFIRCMVISQNRPATQILLQPRLNLFPTHIPVHALSLRNFAREKACPAPHMAYPEGVEDLILLYTYEV